METNTYLTNMKSRYFMLVACLTLILGTTACSNENFGKDLPEQEKTYTRHGKTYTKQELIEQALSRMPQTKANKETRFLMVTMSKTVNIQCYANEDIVIVCDGKDSTLNPNSHRFSYTYPDDYPSHSISILGDEKAITLLDVGDNELISLDINSNTNLKSLLAFSNHLDGIDVSKCPDLEGLYVADNALTSIDLTFAHRLETLDAINNRLTDLDVSKNPQILELWLSNNRIKSLDVSMNPDLLSLTLDRNPLQDLKLPEVSPDFSWLDVAYTQLTNLDFCGSLNTLRTLYLSGVPLKTINGQPFDSTSFADFPLLESLFLANTALTSLDLSQNPLIIDLDISDSDIARLNILNTKLRFFRASYSQLTNLIHGDDLPNLYLVRIEHTPFEKGDWGILWNFCSTFPRRKNETPGHLYTYSPYNLNIYKKFENLGYNWLINQ